MTAVYPPTVINDERVMAMTELPPIPGIMPHTCLCVTQASTVNQHSYRNYTVTLEDGEMHATSTRGSSDFYLSYTLAVKAMCEQAVTWASLSRDFT
jgi:hypothetical protein